MKTTLRLSLWIGIGFLVSSSASAQTSYPMLMSLKPTAAQVGQTSEHTISSRYSMYGANKVLVSGTGVTGEIVHPEKKEGEKPANLTTMKVRFTVAADAVPGVREFRIATPNGVSTIGQLVIVRDQVIAEDAKNNNDKAENAQQVTVPSTICGGIEKNEDVDFYRFSVKAGTELSFHVRSMRLQNKIHDLQQHSDPILTIRHSSGTTLAASDNYFYGDPCLSYRFDRDGEYLLEIRDVRYQGNRYWEYSIEVSDQPFVTGLYPMGVAAGTETRLEMIGMQIPEESSVKTVVPADAARETAWLQLPFGSGKSNPAPVVVSDLPIVVENEGDNGAFEKAQVVTIPCGINGRIGEERDIDCYRFAAKKGEKLTIQVWARRRQSSLDSYLRLVNKDGRQLSVNDDMRIGIRNHSDSMIENWTVPADGEYAIELRDLHLRGGGAFVYFVEITRAEPYFELYIDTDKTQLTPGTSAMLFVRTVRKNGFTGEINLAIGGLPEGVTAETGRILADKGRGDGCILLTAAKDAKMDVANIVVTGTADIPGEGDQKTTMTRTASIYQETYLPGGGRGHWPVSMHTVSVGQPLDILAVELSTTEVVLKPGESKTIDVTIRRAEGFDKNVSLAVEYRHLSGVYGSSLPQGVTVDAKTSKTLLAGKEVKGKITLTAAANAPAVEKQLIPVMANIAINFVMKASYTGPAVYVTVQAP